MFKSELSNDRAGLHIELGFLLLTLLLSGCVTVTSDLNTQEKLEYYNCYWDCPNEEGEIGWCCEKEVPWHDKHIFHCDNAGNRKVVR